MKHESAHMRFSNRVGNYSLYRPNYPTALYDHIKFKTSIDQNSKIIDLGSGTGILSKLFLSKGHHLWGVEPNREMRIAGERYLENEETFVSLEGSAESIPLPDDFADLIIAGQAFHWFNPMLARDKAKRVLKSQDRAALIWNDWHPELSSLLKEYDALLCEFGSDYTEVSRRHVDAQRNISLFLDPHTCEEIKFPNHQSFDYEGFKGRLLSSSYVPLEKNSHFSKMLLQLHEIFERHQRKGVITFNYETRLYLGMLNTEG